MQAFPKDLLFSICIPTYNGEAFIEATLLSLFAQEYKNYELIICDDCSTDTTVSIINRLIEGRENVRFHVNEKNLGLVGNWNRCLGLSRGEYIKFLFQDDTLLPGTLQKTAEVIEKHSPLFITSKREFVLPETYDATSQYHYKTYLQKFENDLGITSDRFVTEKEMAFLTARFFGVNFIGEPSVYVFKKSLLEKTGPFDALFHQLCDLEFALRCISNGNLYYMHFTSCKFVVHERSVTVMNLHTKYFQIHYLEYIRLAALVLYDKKFEKLERSFAWAQRLRVKLFLKYKIHQTLNDKRITEEDVKTLEDFLAKYPVKNNKNSVFYSLLNKILKIKNSAK